MASINPFNTAIQGSIPLSTKLDNASAQAEDRTMDDGGKDTDGDTAGDIV
jgi:hypothetical protein